jgi:hypothetical protein
MHKSVIVMAGLQAGYRRCAKRTYGQAPYDPVVDALQRRRRALRRMHASGEPRHRLCAKAGSDDADRGTRGQDGEKQYADLSEDYPEAHDADGNGNEKKREMPEQQVRRALDPGEAHDTGAEQHQEQHHADEIAGQGKLKEVGRNISGPAQQREYRELPDHRKRDFRLVNVVLPVAHAALPRTPFISRALISRAQCRKRERTVELDTGISSSALVGPATGRSSMPKPRGA